jgi:diguanylate cyclase (GGDEF)-like protein/PAS domain S-box-containing protein
MNAPTLYQVSAEDRDNCAREPIHQTTLLQPHGIVIACDASSGLINFASGNASTYLAIPQASLLGCHLRELIDVGPWDDLWNRLCALQPEAPIPMDIRFKAGHSPMESSEVLVHRSGDSVVIEALPYRITTPELEIHIEFERALREVARLHRHAVLDEFLEACAQEIRRLTGYQRVVIYRFLPDWSGEVIAESCDSAVEVLFRGLRFPASDIPAQARELYKINLLRIIGDVHAQPTVLHSAHPDTPLDLSHSLLRQPSAMHLKYLENMGVRATMTISLLKDGELWGMVSCHHPEPKTPPLQLRRVSKLLCALVAEIAMARLDLLLGQEADARARTFANAPNQLELFYNSNHDFSDAAQKSLAEIAGVMNAQTCGLVVAGSWVCAPQAPPELLEFLLYQVRTLQGNQSLVTHQLADHAPPGTKWVSIWNGAMVLPLPGIADSWVVFLRQVVERKIHWAGAPGKTAVQSAQGLQVLGPRASFQRWTEQVQGQCDPWDNTVRSAGETMAKSLSDVYRTHLNEQMKSQLHLLGSSMESLNDMVVITTTDSIDEPGPQIVFVNQAFVSRTGYSREEVLGKTPRFLQGPETQRHQLDAMRAALRAWKPITVELINYTKSGEAFWVEVSLTVIANAAGWYTHWVAIERDITERKRNESEIRKLANYDLLTGLPNRRMLVERLQLALRTSERYQRNGALLFIDLDNFKDLNDTAGHHVGDELLKQAAQRLTAEVRVQDMVARLGGDEFVVMLEDLSVDNASAAAAAQQVAQKIVKALGQVYDLGGHTYNSTASVGVSLFFCNSHSGSVEEMLKQSDFAMYQAKGAGRNTWRFFDPATQAALMARNAVEVDLNLALIQNQLEPHYQIIVDRERKVIGVEVLLRWRHPVRGLVSPVEFIPVAEHSGLILPIGQWVLQNSCELLATWAQSPERRSWSVAVNVSARQVSQPDFVDKVTLAVMESGCNPELLKLELTESLLQHDFGATVAKMDALRAFGVQFSIDDFGTGYSSLAYLRRLPVSVLKIDRSFVRDIEQNEGDQAICKTVLALGQTLNMSIVAEGVETAAQFAFLETNGCDKFQGFLFGRPVPLGQLKDRVDQEWQ